MTPIIVRLVALIAIFASIFLLSQLFLGGYLNRRAETRAVNRRLQLLRSGLSVERVSEILRKDALERLPDDAGMFQRWYFRYVRTVRMAAMPFNPRSGFIATVLAFLTIFVVALVIAWSSGFQITIGIIQLVVIFALSLAFGLPYLIISRMADSRRKRMGEQFPVALDIFTRALRAGHPVSAAIELLTQEMEDPIGSEFGLVADEVAYGANLTDALMSLAERWDLDDIRMFVVSLSLQSETGGNLAEILTNLSGVIRERAGLYLKVRALSSEGRMSGWMLTALPMLTFLSMVAVNPTFYFSVATDPIFIYGFSGLIVLYIIGVMTIRRMVDLKV